MLNQGEEVVAGGGIAGVVGTLQFSFGRAVERDEAQCGRWKGERRERAGE